MQLHEIAQEIQRIRFEALEAGEDLADRQVFYKLRDETGLKGLKFEDEKEGMDFVRLHAKVKKQMDKPLQLAALRLDAAETKAKEAAIEALYATTPSGPEQVRTLLKLAQDIRGKNDMMVMSALTETARDYGNPELTELLEAAWPGMLEGDDDEATQ